MKAKKFKHADTMLGGEGGIQTSPLLSSKTKKVLLLPAGLSLFGRE